MPISPKAQAWLFIACTFITTGGAVAWTCHQGGSATGWCLLAGAIGGASGLLHVFVTPPGQWGKGQDTTGPQAMVPGKPLAPAVIPPAAGVPVMTPPANPPGPLTP